MSRLVAESLRLLAEKKDVVTSAIENIFNTKTMSTLNISHLSVGDWVEYEGLHYPITFVGYGEGGDGSLVNLIRPDLSCFTCKISDIHPIPITAEILEKNGFERSSFDGRIGSIFRNGNVWFSYEKKIDMWGVSIYIHDNVAITHTALSHIHQLQHALRLAGVDKEINL